MSHFIVKNTPFLTSKYLANMIRIDDFSKIELKAGTILEAEEVPGSEKLVKMEVDLGEDQPRQILAGIKKWYKPENLIGKQVVIIANLKPRMMMGYESKGMVLACGEEKPVLLKPSSKVKNGSRVR